MPENIPAESAQAITLREHLEGRIGAAQRHIEGTIHRMEESITERMAGMRRELDLVHTASKLAIDKAEQAQNLRNEAMNEWRQTFSDRDAHFATKEQVDTLIERTMRLEKFMWLLMGAFVILNLLRPYLPLITGTP